MAQKQKLSIEEKVKIIQAYLSGEISKSEAVRRGGVIWNTMNQWMVDERLCVHAEQLIQQVLVIYMKSTPERGKPRMDHSTRGLPLCINLLHRNQSSKLGTTE